MQRLLELENRDHVQQCDMDTIVESLNSLGLLINQNIVQVRRTN